jgi:hypothetical protein
MYSIVGLISSDSAVAPAVKRLEEAGITEARISISANSKYINQLFGCDPACVIKNYTALGAVIGLGIYAVFGIAAAMCQCNLMEFGQAYGIMAFAGALLAGTFVGGGIGLLVGAGEAEKDTQVYLKGVRSGGKVISVRVAEQEAERVKQILANQKVSDLQVLRPKGA